MLIQSRCARCSCMLKHARLGVCWHHPPSRSPRGCLATAKPPQITHPVALSRIPSRVALAIASFFFGLWKVEPLSVSLPACSPTHMALIHYIVLLAVSFPLCSVVACCCVCMHMVVFGDTFREVMLGLSPHNKQY